MLYDRSSAITAATGPCSVPTFHFPGASGRDNATASSPTIPIRIASKIACRSRVDWRCRASTPSRNIIAPHSPLRNRALLNICNTSGSIAPASPRSIREFRNINARCQRAPIRISINCRTRSASG